MKFSGKMYLKIILKVTKSQGFTLYLEDTYLEKPQGGVGGADWPSLSRFRVKPHRKRLTILVKNYWNFKEEDKYHVEKPAIIFRIFWIIISVMYSEHSQTSMIKRSPKVVDGFQP